METLKGIVSFLFYGILGAAVIFGLSYGSYRAYEFFAPRYAAVDNKVFHETQAYNDGMLRDLEDIKLQYVSAKPEQKEALRAVALHRFSIYPRERMPADLRDFYEKLEGGL